MGFVIMGEIVTQHVIPIKLLISWLLIGKPNNWLLLGALNYSHW